MQMKTTLELGRNDAGAVDGTRRVATGAAIGTDRWAAVCATAGAAVWAGIAVLARIGIARLGAIELLFLFAPLVIVPLGLELGRALGGGGRIYELARRLQPAGAAFAVVAMVVRPGRVSGVLAVGWLVVCLVASRLGMRPMGIQEPIGLLTVVHFHLAGFATAMIGAAMLRFAERRGKTLWLPVLVLMVVGLPFVVAAGFVIAPALKMAAAILFSVSIAGLAICLRAFGRRVEDATARILLQVAAGAVFAGMIFSGVYAIADYLGSDVLTIPQMARTHGILNAVGFCLPGLLGWLVESGVRKPTH